MNDQIYREVVDSLEKTFTFLPAQSGKKRIPYRIKWKGKYIVTQSGKTVWPSLGAAKNAFWNNMNYLTVPSLPPTNNGGYYTSHDYRDTGHELITHHIFKDEREQLEQVKKSRQNIKKKFREKFLKLLEKDEILEFEPQKS